MFTQSWMLITAPCRMFPVYPETKAPIVHVEASVRNVKDLLAFKKRALAISIRFQSLPRPVIRRKSIVSVTTDMQDRAHVIGLNALHRQLVVWESHELNFHSTEYKTRLSIMGIYRQNGLLRS